MRIGTLTSLIIAITVTISASAQVNNGNDSISINFYKDGTYKSPSIKKLIDSESTLKYPISVHLSENGQFLIYNEEPALSEFDVLIELIDENTYSIGDDTKRRSWKAAVIKHTAFNGAASDSTNDPISIKLLANGKFRVDDDFARELWTNDLYDSISDQILHNGDSEYSIDGFPAHKLWSDIISQSSLEANREARFYGNDIKVAVMAAGRPPIYCSTPNPTLFWELLLVPSEGDTVKCALS